MVIKGYDDINFFIHCFLGALRYQFKPGEVALYRLNSIRDLHSLPFTISAHTLHRLRPYFNSPAGYAILSSRSAFHRWCEENRIIHPKTFGIISKNSSADEMAEETDKVIRNILEEKPSGVVIKRSKVSHGDGCLFVTELEYTDQEIFGHEESGNRVSLHKLLYKTAAESGGDITVEQHLLQNKVLRQMHSNSLNTIRVVTFLNHSDDVEIDMAVLRVGNNDSYVDSWQRGGLGSAVHLKTGELGPGLVMRGARGGRWFRTHPHTGARIEGIRVPEWKRVRELVKEAAVNFPEARWVGWDVAVTDNGPVLIEGNYYWALPFMLAHTGGRCPASWKSRLSDPGLPVPRGYISGVRYFFSMMLHKTLKKY